MNDFIQESAETVVESANKIENLTTELYSVLGDNKIIDDLNSASARLQTMIEDKPYVVETEEKLARGGKVGEIFNERFSFMELIFGKRKFLKGGVPQPNVFKQAVAQAKKPTKGGGKYEIVELLEKDYPDISNTLEQMAEINQRLKDDEKQYERLHGEVLEIAHKEFLKLYDTKQTNPDTFIMNGEFGGCVMIVPQDRYKMTDEEKAKAMVQQFNKPDMVETKTVFSFNPEMLQKYESVISDFIMNSPDIRAEDKDKIVEAKVTYSIRKGMIDRLMEFKANMAKAFTAIQPVFQIRTNC